MKFKEWNATLTEVVGNLEGEDVGWFVGYLDGEEVGLFVACDDEE